MVQIPSTDRRLKTYAHEISGGMRQRAMIAQALSCRPSVLLADEPDATVQIQIILLLRQLQQELGMAAVFVTHNVGVAVEVADRIAVMYAGISPAAAAKYGKDLGTNPVGTGPFIFKEWEPGSRLVVDKNPSYWESGKPYLDRIVFLQTSNPVVGVPRLLTRELDFVAALTPIDIRPLEGRPGLRLIRSPGNRWMALRMRIDRPPFDNLRLRQAMAHALDRKRIVDIVMSGKADVANGPTPPGLWWFDPDLRGYPYDPAKARALLAEAGVSPDLELTLSTNPVAINQQVSQLAQEQLRAIGLKVRIEPVSISDWYPQLLNGAINFLPIRWSHRPDPDGLLTYLYHSKSAHNSSHYINPELDAMLERARGLGDRDARRDTYKTAQTMIVRDLPYIYLFHSIEFAAMRDEVRNYVWIPDEIPRFREVWKAR